MDQQLLDYLLKRQQEEEGSALGDSMTKAGSQLGAAIAGAQPVDTSAVDSAAKMRQDRSAKVNQYLMQKSQSDEAAALARQKSIEDKAFRAEQGQLTRDAADERMKDRNQTSRDLAGMANAIKVSQFEQGEDRRKNQLRQSVGKQVRTEQLDTLEPGIQAVESIIAKYDGKDLPGAGTWDSTVANLTGNRVGPEDGKALRQETQRLANVLLKSRSGAAVTDQEYRRFLAEMGSGSAMSEAAFKRGISMMRRDIDNIKDTVRNENPDMYDEVMGGRGPGAVSTTAPVGGTKGSTSAPSSFPRQVRKGTQVATVNNQAELDEATQEGFQ
jgi:cytochrome c556